MRVSIVLAYLLVFAFAMLIGCGGNKGPLPQPAESPSQAESPSTGLQGLVSPNEAIKQLSFVGEERIRTGSQYTAELPSENVFVQGSACDFNPGFVPPDNTALKDAAYAIYTFNIPEYNGGPVLRTTWDTSPADIEKMYFGVGNFVTNSWDWAVARPDGFVSLDYLSDHKSPTGVVLIAAVLTGEEPASLAWLKIGDNVGPVANVNADPLMGDFPLAVEFDASGSLDHDGTIASYEWDLDGDGTFEIGPSTESSTTHNFDTAGSYDSAVRVTDDLGETEIAYVTINANVPGNLYPIASVSADPTTGLTPLRVDFSGFTSFDPDGSITLYEWDWENDGVYDESSPADPNASHTFYDDGTFIVVLRVTDNLGVTDTDTVSISVEDSGTPNELPVARLVASPMNQTAPFMANFDATASSDIDGAIVKYEFDWESSGSFVEQPAITQHSYSLPGNHDCMLRVTDNLGATGIYVLRLTGNSGGYSEFEDNDDAANGNAVPAIDFSGFTGNLGPLGYNGDDDDWFQLHLVENNRYRVFMSGFLDDDADLDMELFREDGTTSVDSSTTTSNDEEIIWVCDATGLYTLRCYVYNDSGQSDYTLEISSVLLVPPVADIQATPTSGDWPLTVDFDASGSTDADGTIVKYEWDFDGNGTFEEDGDTEPTFTYEYTDAGVVDAAVRVTDDTAATSIATIEITVLNDPPDASFTVFPSSGARPLTVQFDASASTDPDPDGGIVRYEWDFDGDGRVDLSKTDASTDPPLATAVYFATGTFEATLTVTDVAGSEGTTTREITVTGSADNESEPNNDEDAANTDQDAAMANSFPAFPFANWFGVVGPKPITDGPFGDPDDWYKFTVISSGEVDIYMELFHDVCDIDMKLYAAGNYSTTVGSSGGVDDDEQITVSLDAGTYYLRVHAFTGAPASGGYRIQATFTP